MWNPKSIRNQITDELSNVFRNPSLLTVIVGNGLSRLSGAHEWSRILCNETRTHYFNDTLKINLEKSIEQGLPLPELAQILYQNNKALYDGLVYSMRNEFEKLDTNIIHNLFHDYLRDAQYLTTNYDNLLERSNLRHVVHLHGTFEKPIITDDQYYESIYEVKQTLANYIGNGRIALFLGYGHSHYDYDILQALKELSHYNFNRGRIYTIISNLDNTPYLQARLIRLGIQSIIYELPNNPTEDQRKLALAFAIKEIMETAGIDIVGNTRDQLEQLFEEQRSINKKSVVCIGLTAVNTLLEPQLPNSYWIDNSEPTKPEFIRFNLKANQYREIGGPAYVISKLLSHFGLHSELISKFANDPEGDWIYKNLLSKDNKTLHADFVERDEPIDKLNGYGTWQSMILVDHKEVKNRQRVFFDRTIDVDVNVEQDLKNKLQLSSAALNVVKDNIITYQPPIIYFDKFYQETVATILGARVPINSWIVYETGANGDKYNKHQYYFETNIINNKVNILTSSFSFSRDYLCRYILQKNGIPVDNSLLEKIEKYVDGKPAELSSQEKRLVIRNLIGNKQDLDAFVLSVAKGANIWLRRDEGPRLIIITLNEFGCIWIKLGEFKTSITNIDFDFDYVEVPAHRKVNDSWYTNSAGDIFRGALIAGLMKARINHNDDEGKFLDKKDNISKICRFANEISAMKISVPLFKQILGEAKKVYDNFSI
jgi:sugar/nucleoside kinase (ribokinase family)